MTPEDLCTAVREALDEAEKIAHLAVERLACGCHAGALTDSWRYGGDAAVMIDNGTGHDVFTGAAWGGAYLDPDVGCYIAHNDPSSVLRRVAADRRVLERHSFAAGPLRLWCVTQGNVAWPCPDFVDLADRYGMTTEETPDGR